jgi:hypothetical protein
VKHFSATVEFPARDWLDTLERKQGTATVASLSPRERAGVRGKATIRNPWRKYFQRFQTGTRFKTLGLDKRFKCGVLCAHIFMRALFLSFIAVGVLLVSGCETGKVCDLRREGGEVCEIHHDVMHSEKYPNPHRKTPPSPEYLQARTKSFMHAKPTLFMLPDDCKYCTVWLCDECVAAESQWKASHPGMAP